MANGRKTVVSDDKKLMGMHIYEDKRGRSIYYDVFSKRGYVLTNNEERYKQYARRFSLGIIAMVLVYLFDVNWIICLIVGLAVYGFMEYKFRRFLSSLTIIENFVPEKKAKSNIVVDKKKVATKTVLYLAFGALILVNAKQQNYTDITLYGSYAISVFAFGMAIYQAYLLLKKSA